MPPTTLQTLVRNLHEKHNKESEGLTPPQKSPQPNVNWYPQVAQEQAWSKEAYMNQRIYNILVSGEEPETSQCYFRGKVVKGKKLICSYQQRMQISTSCFGLLFFLGLFCFKWFSHINLAAAIHSSSSHADWMLPARVLPLELQAAGTLMSCTSQKVSEDSVG